MLFKELAVVNYGNIKKARIDLDYKGLTFILGKNKDAGPGATNGAGKSQFWTAIPEIAYGTPPTGKDTHKHKNTKLRLVIESGGHDYSFTKAYGKTGSKAFTVLKDGKDVHVRTLAHPQKKLQTLLGKTEEDFYTKVYVDSLKAHPLIVGSAAQRQEFFVRMFNLENVDAMRKLLLAELSSIQKVAAAYREVRALFDEAKANLKTTEEERAALSTEIEDLRARRDRLITKTEELQHVRDLLSFEEDNEKLLTRFHKLTSVESFKDDYTEAQRLARKYKALRTAALEWVSYAKELKDYTKESDALMSKVKSLVGDRWDRSELKDSAERYKLLKREQDVLASKLDDFKDLEAPEKVEEPKHDADKCARKVGTLKDELKHSEEFEDGKCPTCGSSVKARGVKAIRAELHEWVSNQTAAKEYVEYKAARKAYVEAKEKKAQLVSRLEEVTAKVVKLDRKAKAYDLLRELPSKPEKPEGDKVDLESVESKLDVLKTRLAFYEAVEPSLERIAALGKLTKTQRQSAEEYTDLSAKLTKINTVLTKREAFKIQQDEAVKQLSGLRLKGKLLKRQTEDEELLKELVSAYSSKGIKKLLIQRSAALLQQQVNKFVRFVFSEDFSFEFKYTTRLEVLVHRKYGKSVKTSDVKRLSGAEKKMFTLLLVIAGYTITPAKRRSNLLILDELEANMGPEAVKNFLRMLPILNKIIPHIVVITPRPELHIDGARYFTAVKHRGITTLVEGRQ